LCCSSISYISHTCKFCSLSCPVSCNSILSSCDREDSRIQTESRPRWLIASRIQRRRIQMRFKNNNDYQRVFHIFDGLKFPISNSVATGTSAAPMMPVRPASTSLIQNPSRPYHKDQTSLSDVANHHEARASNTVNDASYALHRPFLTEESPFFRRSHTASSETVRPGSSLSLGGSKDSDTISSIPFGEPLVRSSSVIDYVRPMSSLSASQFEKEVCKYFPKFCFPKSLHTSNVTNCFPCTL
jgi:hypothetical protein